MSTGVPQSGNANKKPYSIEYEGKHNKNEILGLSFSNYKLVSSVNGGGGNKLFFGDNLDVLLFLLNNGYKGKVQLIYIDPPFATESVFLKRDQSHAYSDSLCGSDYIEFLRERLIILRELLTDDGSIYVHLDHNMVFPIKIIMDEIFGARNCRAFITRKKCSTKNTTHNTYGNISDYIMFYSKTSSYIWNRPYTPWDMNKMIEQYPYVDNNGRRYKKVPIHAPGVRNGETGKKWRGMLPPEGKHWQYTPAKLDEFDAAGEIYWSPSGNPRRMVFCDETKGVPVQNIWMEYRDSVNQSVKTTGYPTEKNYDMVKMIVEASSNKGGLVLDCFAGSGTTLGAANELQRQWIGVDNSKESIKCILKRFNNGLEIYGDYVNNSNKSNRQISFDSLLKCPFDMFTKNGDAIIFK